MVTKIRMMHVSHATVRTNFSSTRSSVSLTSWIMAHVSLCWLVGYNPFLFFFPSHASNNNKSKLTCDHVKQTFNKIIDEIYLEFLSLFLLWKKSFKTYLFEIGIFHSKKLQIDDEYYKWLGKFIKPFISKHKIYERKALSINLDWNTLLYCVLHCSFWLGNIVHKLANETL